jgi:acetyltransferase-like isoleucine patch superfamily enzyme
VRVEANCYVAEFTTIEDDVALAAGVCLANDPHPGSADHACMRGPTIGRGAQIGMNSTIFPFVTIGERSLVEAGSVVTRAVPAELVVGGNPARVVKSISEVNCPLDLQEGAYLAGETPLGNAPMSRRD